MHWITEPSLKALAAENSRYLPPTDNAAPVGTVLRNSETGERWMRMLGRDGRTAEWRLLADKTDQAQSLVTGRLDAIHDTLRAILRVERSIQHGIAILVDDNDLTPLEDEGE